MDQRLPARILPLSDFPAKTNKHKGRHENKIGAKSRKVGLGPAAGWVVPARGE
jgi:hypothetical protein